jgi:hypothetical protein
MTTCVDCGQIVALGSQPVKSSSPTLLARDEPTVVKILESRFGTLWSPRWLTDYGRPRPPPSPGLSSTAARSALDIIEQIDLIRQPDPFGRCSCSAPTDVRARGRAPSIQWSHAAGPTTCLKPQGA